MFRRKGRKNKLGAKKVTIDGHKFPSKLEAAVYVMLKRKFNDGLLLGIELQDKVYLTDAKILFKPDFKVTALDGSVHWVEAKGLEMPVYAIKKRLWKHYGPGDLHIYKGSYVNPKLVETVSSLLHSDQNRNDVEHKR